MSKLISRPLTIAAILLLSVSCNKKTTVSAGEERSDSVLSAEEKRAGAVLLTRENKYSSAEELLSSLIVTQPTDSEAYYLRAGVRYFRIFGRPEATNSGNTKTDEQDVGAIVSDLKSYAKLASTASDIERVVAATKLLEASAAVSMTDANEGK